MKNADKGCFNYFWRILAVGIILESYFIINHVLGEIDI